MSRILRRPMFRGGPVSSYGTGIATGLGYNDGGRVGYVKAGKVKSYEDTICLLYTSPSPRDGLLSRMPSSA